MSIDNSSSSELQALSVTKVAEMSASRAATAVEDADLILKGVRGAMNQMAELANKPSLAPRSQRPTDDTKKDLMITNSSRVNRIKSQRDHGIGVTVRRSLVGPYVPRNNTEACRLLKIHKQLRHQLWLCRRALSNKIRECAVGQAQLIQRQKARKALVYAFAARLDELLGKA